MKRPGKTNPAKFSSSNKKVLTGPFFKLKLLKLTTLHHFQQERIKRTFNDIEIENSTRVDKFKAD